MAITTFSSFKSRNYRLYFFGQSISLIGTWMQKTAVSWVVYTMTHSAFMLGLTIFATQFPSFLFSLPGGIVSDRYNRYKVLLTKQIASMVQGVLLTVVVFAGNYTVWEILALSVVLGMINAFDVPARQPLVHEMVNDKADLPNALALNSTMNNLARLIGPALSGIVLEKFGAGTCFLLNAISFGAVIISLLLMKLPAYIPSTIKKKVTAEVIEGLFVLPYNTLLPIFAKAVFNGGAATFGYINSFIGLGAVSGAIFLASLKPGADLKFVLLINTIIFGIGLMFFSHISYFPLAMLFAVVCGFGTMSQSTICNTIIQVNSAAPMRGRVMSFIAMSIFGMLPVGSLLIGFVSQKIGAPNAVLCQGIIAIIIAIYFSNFLRKDKLDKKEASQFEEVEDVIMEKI